MVEWTSEQKEKYVLDALHQCAREAGSNEFFFTPLTVTDGEDEFGVTFLTKAEQRHILEIFDFQNIIRFSFVDSENLKPPYKIRLIPPDAPRLSHYCRLGYKTERDVLLDASLRDELKQMITTSFGVIDAREVSTKSAIRTYVNERDDEKVLLLEELGIIKADWEDLKNQTHRTVGNRLISVHVQGDKAAHFISALTGQRSSVKPKAIELLAAYVKDLMTLQGWFEFFLEQGIPSSLAKPEDTKYQLVHRVLLTLTSTGDANDKYTFIRIIQALAHPLMYGGDQGRATKAELQISSYLQYDGICIEDSEFVLTNPKDAQQSTRAREEAAKKKDAEDFTSTDFSAIFNTFAKPTRAPQEQAQARPVTPPSKTEIHIHNNNQNTVQSPTPQSEVAKPDATKTTLSGKVIEFFDDKETISIGGKVCALPAYTNQHYFCRAMFESMTNEAVDWSLVYERMAGHGYAPTKLQDTEPKKKRAVYDAMRAINTRIQETLNTEDELFVQAGKSIIRKY